MIGGMVKGLLAFPSFTLTPYSVITNTAVQRSTRPYLWVHRVRRVQLPEFIAY